MTTSKLTSKGRTTIPLAVRNALCLRSGDKVGYVIDGDRVFLCNAAGVPGDDPFAEFSEWASATDRLGYADL